MAGDFLKAHLEEGADLSVVSAYFTEALQVRVWNASESG